MSGVLEDAVTLVELTAEKHVREDVNCIELAHNIISGAICLLMFTNFVFIRMTTSCSRNLLLDILLFALIFLSATTYVCST
jgi:hypothetical protein